MKPKGERFIISKVELANLDAIERVASLSVDGIKPNNRMVYYLGCTLFKKYTIVLKKDSQLIGFLLSFPDAEEKILWIHQIAIYKEYRGKGFGTKMMDVISEMAYKTGFEKLQFAVNPKNRAINLYLRLGFEEVGIAKEINMMIMEKKLHSI